MPSEPTPTRAPARKSNREPSPSPAVPTRTISARIPEAVFEGLQDAARLRGHSTITEAIVAAIHLYMQDALENDEALQAVLAARSALEEHLRQLAPQGN